MIFMESRSLTDCVCFFQREERIFNLLNKYKSMGETIEAPFPEGTEPTEIVTFYISSLFDMYQILSLTLTFRTTKGGARGTALCSELLAFDKAALKGLKKFNLGKFLERNDEKRMSALADLTARVWAAVKEPLYACPIPDVAAAEAELERLAAMEPAPEEAAEEPEAEPEAAAAAPVGPAVSRDVLDYKLNGTWGEFMMLKDVTEAVECTKEFAHPDHNDLVIKVLIIEKLLEAKATAVDGQIELLAKLLCELRKTTPATMTAADMEKGLLRSCSTWRFPFDHNLIARAFLTDENVALHTCKFFLLMPGAVLFCLTRLLFGVCVCVAVVCADAVADASLDSPSCPAIVAKLCAQLIAAGCIPLGILGKIFVEADLVAFGTAAKIVILILTGLKETEVRCGTDTNMSHVSLPLHALTGSGCPWCYRESGWRVLRRCLLRRRST